jgi:hypothetical protein
MTGVDTPPLAKRRQGVDTPRSPSEEHIMPLYFLLLSDSFYRERMRPVLAASWRLRSFEPCRALCKDLLPAAHAFAERYHTNPDQTILGEVAARLAFDKDRWTALVGEVLWFSASEIPEIQTAPEALRCLLAPAHFGERDMPREHFAPIQQAHYGARDLILGGRYYRPEQVGFNDAADVARLENYLTKVNPQGWTPADLAPLAELTDEEERADELEYVRDWFPALCELYQRARQRSEMVVCEILTPRADYDLG